MSWYSKENMKKNIRGNVPYDAKCPEKVWNRKGHICRYFVRKYTFTKSKLCDDNTSRHTMIWTSILSDKPSQLVQSAESDSGCYLKKLCIKAFVNIWLVVKRDYLHYQRDSQKYRLHLWKALNFFLNHSNMSFLGEYNTALIILIASVLKDTNHVIFPLWSQICFLFTYINLALRQFKPHMFAFPATALFHEIPMYTNDLLSNTALISSDMLVGRPKPSTYWLQFPKYAMSTVLTLL